jgi:intracellular multiplication protein IcmE
MAGKKDNIKALFTNTRSRVVIMLTAFLLLATILFGYFKFKSPSSRVTTGADISASPGGIQSIPGSTNPTAQYASLQEKQNIDQAKVAVKSGLSAIPTIVRSENFGAGVTSVGPQKGTGALGFTALSTSDLSGPQQSLWIDQLKKSDCSKSEVAAVMAQGAGLSDLKAVCSCAQLKDNGYSLTDLKPVCSCPDLKAAGFNAIQLKAAGYSAARLVKCGFNACDLRAAGFTAQELQAAGMSDGELKGAGFSTSDINNAGGLPPGISEEDVRKAGCQPQALRRLRAEGLSAAAVRRISGCSAAQLKAAGYTAKELKEAGFTAAELKRAGFTAAQLKAAGYDARDLLNAGFTPAQLAAAGYSPDAIKEAEKELPPGITPEDVKNAGCSEDAIKREREAGISAELIHKYAGCTGAALKAGGFSDADLANAGFKPDQISKAGMSDADIKAAGCDSQKLKKLSEAGVSANKIHALNGCDVDVKPAGLETTGIIAAGRVANCSAASLKTAYESGVSAKTIRDMLGCSAAALKAAGYSAAQLKNAGFTAADLKAAGFSAADLKNAGFTNNDLEDAGFSPQELARAGIVNPSELTGLDGLRQKASVNPEVILPPAAPLFTGRTAQAEANEKQLNDILKRQKDHAADQQYQQKIQQKIGQMTGAANQALQGWKTGFSQAKVGSWSDDKEKSGNATESSIKNIKRMRSATDVEGSSSSAGPGHPPVIHAGEILFAVLDTSVNSDQPGPILATIVAGRFNGAKLIGSFTRPDNGDKLVISFNMMSVPGASKTTSINAYAIDPSTARTALASRVNHHYLSRYGSLFAATFIEGFGNAFQSAGTTVTIGGTGGVTTTTVANGVGRSVLENAVIGLSTVGQNWGQVAMRNVNTPVTIDLFSGTGLGILFTQDIASV